MRSYTLVNVGYRSTNFYVIGAGRTKLLVDLGWMGMLGALSAELGRKGIALTDITHGFATHYHLDHAGLAQELKATGTLLIITPEQLAAAPVMKQWAKPQDHYVDIVLNDAKTRVVTLNESRAFLSDIGIDGELIHTPGHSDDSVSVLLDDGSVFTGDLTHPAFAEEKDAEVVAKSWNALRDKGATTVYPGHGPARPMHGA